MAIEFFTGFEGCGVTADVQTFVTSGDASYSATGGYNNGKCLSQSSSFNKDCTAALTKCVGFHLYNFYPSVYTTNANLHLVRFTIAGSYIRVFNTPSDGITVYKDASLLGTIGSGNVFDSGLHHVQIKVVNHASAGSVEIKIDGVTVGTLTSLAISSDNITSLTFGSGNNTVKYDNLYIADDFLGEIYSVLCSPTSDSSVQFTPSAGSNYACVDDSAQDGDTTYVESSTVGNKDLYGFGDVATSGISVKVATLVTVARKDDAGARTLTPIAKQDSTEYDQTTITLTTSYPSTLNSGKINVLSTAPDSSAWTPTIFNAMTWGFKVAA